MSLAIVYWNICSGQIDIGFQQLVYVFSDDLQHGLLVLHYTILHVCMLTSPNAS